MGDSSGNERAIGVILPRGDFFASWGIVGVGDTATEVAAPLGVGFSMFFGFEGRVIRHKIWESS